MQAKIYRYVDGIVLGENDTCNVARPWVVEIDGKIKANSIGSIIRFSTSKSAEQSLMEDLISAQRNKSIDKFIKTV